MQTIYLVTIQHGDMECHYTSCTALSTAKSKARLAKQQTHPRTAIGRVYQGEFGTDVVRTGTLVYTTVTKS